MYSDSITGNDYRFSKKSNFISFKEFRDELVKAYAKSLINQPTIHNIYERDDKKVTFDEIERLADENVHETVKFETRDGKHWGQHRPLKHISQVFAKYAWAKYVYVSITLTQWGKKGQSLCVVVVSVREQQCANNRVVVLCPLRHQLFSQANDARPGVDDDQVRPGVHFETGRIASKFKRTFARDRETTTYPPKRRCELGHKLPLVVLLSFPVQL